MVYYEAYQCYCSGYNPENILIDPMDIALLMFFQFYTISNLGYRNKRS